VRRDQLSLVLLFAFCFLLFVFCFFFLAFDLGFDFVPISQADEGVILWGF